MLRLRYKNIKNNIYYTDFIFCKNKYVRAFIFFELKVFIFFDEQCNIIFYEKFNNIKDLKKIKKMVKDKFIALGACFYDEVKKIV